VACYVYRCGDGRTHMCGYSLLDSKDATSLEYKLDSFSSVYRRLTGKDVVFEFPVVSHAPEKSG
jgi:hypothetical protein